MEWNRALLVTWSVIAWTASSLWSFKFQVQRYDGCPIDNVERHPRYKGPFLSCHDATRWCSASTNRRIMDKRWTHARSTPFALCPCLPFGNSAQNRFVGRGSLQNGWSKNRQTDRHHRGEACVYVSMCACLPCLCAQKYKRGGEEVGSGNKMSSGLWTKISYFTSSCNLSCLISRRAKWGRNMARKNSHPWRGLSILWHARFRSALASAFKGSCVTDSNHEKILVYV